ncbi:MAG: hypothetical protein ACYS7Y_35190, partial [Planctomycetota bacterium]
MERHILWVDKSNEHGYSLNSVQGAGPTRTPTLVGPSRYSSAPDADTIDQLNSEGLPIDPSGRMNAADVLYEVRDIEGWKTKFRNNEWVKKNFSEDQVEDFITGLDRVHAMFGGDLTGIPDDTGVSPLRSNEDIYGFTFDITTICPQQDEYMANIVGIQDKLGRILSQEERFMVGLEMSGMGLVPACWYCYGQSGRDAYQYAFESAAAKWGWMAEQLEKGPIPTKKELKKTVWGAWKTDGKFMEAIQKYRKKNPTIDGKRLFDIVEGRVDAKNAAEAEIAEIVRGVAQGAIKPNLPKGYASYQQQLQNMLRFAGGRAKLAKANRMGGVRMNSQSDFRPWYVIDTMQFLAAVQSINSSAHVFTRVPEFIEIFGDTGVKFNMSMEFARDPDGTIMRDADGRAMFNDMNGMPTARAMEFREKYPNAGTMIVAMNDAEVLEALGDDRVDMVIPFHRGRVTGAIEKAQYAKNFEGIQHEHWNNAKPAEIAKVLGMTLRTLQNHRKNVTGPYSHLKAKDKKAVKDLKPSDYAFNITREHHHSSREEYLAITKQMGITPRFEEYSGHDGYMKVVNDIARDPENIQVVDVNKTDFGRAASYLDEWVQGGREAYAAKANPAAVDLISAKMHSGDYGTMTPANRDLMLKMLEAGTGEDLSAAVPEGQFETKPNFYSQLSQRVDGLKQLKGNG